MNLQFRRNDGTFVAIINGLPYHIVHEDVLHAVAVEKAAKLGAALPFEPDPEPGPEPIRLKRLHKAELWRRLTDAEAESLDAMLAASPVRLRRIFESASYIDQDDADFPTLRAGIVSALGEVRANQILTPDH